MDNKEIDKQYGSYKLNELERKLETAKTEEILIILKEIIEEEKNIYGESPTLKEMGEF